jgi:hypothetical protein
MGERSAGRGADVIKRSVGAYTKTRNPYEHRRNHVPKKTVPTRAPWRRRVRDGDKELLQLV